MQSEQCWVSCWCVLMHHRQLNREKGEGGGGGQCPDKPQRWWSHNLHQISTQRVSAPHHEFWSHLYWVPASPCIHYTTNACCWCFLSPTQYWHPILHQFQDTLKHLHPCDFQNLLICGDFNINVSDSASPTSFHPLLEQLCLEFSLS